MITIVDIHQQLFMPLHFSRSFFCLAYYTPTYNLKLSLNN
jgi:hypothetical protein